MCKLYRDNLLRVNETIASMRQFTEADLVARLVSANEDALVIDGRQTLHDYLEALNAVGALSVEDGVYRAGPKAWVEERDAAP